jgi:hypothetical protein
MLTRRRLTAGLLLGVPAASLAAGEESRQQTGNPELDLALIEAVRQIATQLRAFDDPPAIAAIRDAQRPYLRTRQVFPDFMEIGVGIWEQLYDWHIHTQQPLRLARLPDGRYTMQALQTTFVLGPTAQNDYIGPPTETP